MIHQYETSAIGLSIECWSPAAVIKSKQVHMSEQASGWENVRLKTGSSLNDDQSELSIVSDSRRTDSVLPPDSTN